MGRKKRRGRTRRTPGPPAGHRTISVRLLSLEIARGDDGLLGGWPEPVLLIAAYDLGGPVPAIVGRSAVELRPCERFPSVVVPATELLFRARCRAGDAGLAAILAIALERDSGRDVERLYADLPEPAAFRAWQIESAMPAPAPLDEIARATIDSTPARRVNVIHRGRDLRDSCSSDVVVGACVLGVALPPTSLDVRLPFVSVDRRNDWTAVLRLGGAAG
ncbi:MAG: hypothetical protein HYY06_05680 [Deltaproteobacteria bacterium]|nr:hypothetical protein [Deltaproteobacteria bacterium]